MHCSKMSFNRRKLAIFFCFLNTTFASEQFPWQQAVRCGMYLPNHYTRAKLEKVLPITSKHIDH